jgi:hypothetical protein
MKPTSFLGLIGKSLKFNGVQTIAHFNDNQSNRCANQSINP